MNDESEGSFLNRWAARKRDSATDIFSSENDAVNVSAPSQILGGKDTATTVLPETASSLDESSQLDASDQSAISGNQDIDTEEVLLTDADMPAIESLTADSNVSAFFNKGVSTALRKAALRYVFQLPKFNVRDGLNDYDGDYTVFEPLGDIVTSDMKFHIARKERDRLAAEAERERAEQLMEQEQLESESTSEEESSDKLEGDEVDKEGEDQSPSNDEDEAGGGQSPSEDEPSPQLDESPEDAVDKVLTNESAKQLEPDDDHLSPQASMSVEAKKQV